MSKASKRLEAFTDTDSPVYIKLITLSWFYCYFVSLLSLPNVTKEENEKIVKRMTSYFVGPKSLKPFETTNKCRLMLKYSFLYTLTEALNYKLLIQQNVREP